MSPFNSFQTHANKKKRNTTLPCTAQQGLYQVVYHNLILPNLPAPLHYLNFMCLMGRPRLAITPHNQIGQSPPHNHAHIMLSSSPNLMQYQQNYALHEACQFDSTRWKFAQIDQIDIQSPHWHFYHKQDGFMLDLAVQAHLPSAWLISHWGMAQAWSAAVDCSGQLHYQGQQYAIQANGCLNYARALPLPLWPIYFYCLQVVQLDTMQVVLLQMRNQWNQIINSQLAIRDELGQLLLKRQVKFHIQRVYPKSMTPNGQCMYLPREFSWVCVEDGKPLLELHGYSRGDFKYGLGAGYVGSFRFELCFAGQDYSGEAAYCEYIDCRPLRFQEKDLKERNLDQLFSPQTCMLKKEK